MPTPGEKAPTTGKRRSASVKTDATGKRSAAATEAVSPHESQVAEDVDRWPVQVEHKGAEYDWRSECIDVRSVRLMEGGALYSARRRGLPVLVSDARTLADLVPEIADVCITIREFRSVKERSRYLRAKGW
jgi:hypothetical protein